MLFMSRTRAVDVGLLILRLGVGGLLLFHGWGKVADLLAGQTSFADPLGIGALPTKILAAFAEFVCAGLVVLGVKVRWAALPPLATMLVATFIVHATDGMEKQELPLLFAFGYAALAVAGGGRYGLERLWQNS